MILSVPSPQAHSSGIYGREQYRYSAVMYYTRNTATCVDCSSTAVSAAMRLVETSLLGRRSVVSNRRVLCIIRVWCILWSKDVVEPPRTVRLSCTESVQPFGCCGMYSTTEKYTPKYFDHKYRDHMLLVVFHGPCCTRYTAQRRPNREEESTAVMLRRRRNTCCTR